MLPANSNDKETNVTNLRPKPLEEAASQGHQRAVGKDGNDGDNVEHMLPNANSTSLLSQRPTSATTKLVGIEPHRQQMVYQYWAVRKSCMK